MDAKPQQTIESAVRSDSGEVVHASDLLLMDEKDFTALRRATWPPTRRPDLPGPTLTFQCSLCSAPLSLSRLHRGGTTINRFFSHREAIDQTCPWLNRNRLRPDQVEALNFFRLHESGLHRRMKHFIADAMRCDPATAAGSVIVDRFQIGQVLSGERKRPDVRATWQGHAVVFEMQLYHTAVSQVVRRHYFYKTEGCFLIWVFKQRDPDRAAVLDEAFHNRRNLFVLDEDAEAATIEHGRLMLKCHYVLPALDEQRRVIVENEAELLISLCDLTFPADGSQPYFIDCDALLEQLEDRLEDLKASHRQQETRRREEQLARQKQLQEEMLRAAPMPEATTAVLPARSSTMILRAPVRTPPPPSPAPPPSIEKPVLYWAEHYDRYEARKAGSRYQLTHPKTDWRQVFADALQASGDGRSVEAMIDTCALKTGAREGDIKNFLISTTLASRRKRIS